MACRVFSCGMRDLVPQIGIEPGPPALGSWRISHWPTREAPQPFFVTVPPCAFLVFSAPWPNFFILYPSGCPTVLGSSLNRIQGIPLGRTALAREDTWDQPWWGQVCKGGRERDRQKERDRDRDRHRETKRESDQTGDVQPSLANLYFLPWLLYSKLVHF